MQLIAKTSEEGGCAPGLALIGATVKKIPLVNNIKIPHMGWNNVCHDSLGLFKNIEADADFYFVHSYRMEVDDLSARCYFTEYGEKIVAYIEKENIYGTQFHPEKSQGDGLKVLRNFGALC
jgi:glutamine amidotransferase